MEHVALEDVVNAYALWLEAEANRISSKRYGDGEGLQEHQNRERYQAQFELLEQHFLAQATGPSWPDQ